MKKMVLIILLGAFSSSLFAGSDEAWYTGKQLGRNEAKRTAYIDENYRRKSEDVRKWCTSQLYKHKDAQHYINYKDLFIDSCVTGYMENEGKKY